MRISTLSSVSNLIMLSLTALCADVDSFVTELFKQWSIIDCLMSPDGWYSCLGQRLVSTVQLCVDVGKWGLLYLIVKTPGSATCCTHDCLWQESGRFYGMPVTERRGRQKWRRQASLVSKSIMSHICTVRASIKSKCVTVWMVIL